MSPPASATPAPAPAQGSMVLTVLQNIVTAINGLSSAFKITSSSASLIAVSTPSNANAATAGVAVGQFYRDTADPSRVYIRSV
jgi:hypothetical protein